MFAYTDSDGRSCIELAPGESVTVELPGGNGESFTVDGDGRSVTDETGFDLTSAYWRA